MKQTIALVTTAALLGGLLVGCSGTSAEESVAKAETDSQSTTVSVSATALSFDSDQFSTSDYEVGYISDVAVPISLSDGGSSCEDSSVTISGNTITITQEGTYSLSGSLTEGQILVDADDSAKIQLILDGVTLSNSSTAPIYVAQADKVFLTTNAGTDNQIIATLVEDDSADTNVDAAIFSKEDLTLNGEGSLTIQATDGNGITSKDDLVVTSGTYTITADKHGLEANNSIRIAGGTFDITAEKDGLHSEHDEDTSLGYIYIIGGTFVMDVQGDGIDSSAVVQIEDGDFDITTAGGSEAAGLSASTTSSSGFGQGQMGSGMTGQQGMTGMTGQQDMAGMTGQQDMAGMTGQQDMTGMTGQQGMTDMTGQQDMTGMTGQQGMTSGIGGDRGVSDDLIPAITDALADGVLTEDEWPDEMELPDGMTFPMDVSGMTGDMSGGMTGTMPGQTGDSAMTGREDMMASTQTGMQDIDGDDEVSTKGIKANDTICITGGTFQLDCFDDALHANQTLDISGGTFTIQTGDDALHADWDTMISGGDFTVLTCYEGIEGERVDISGGTFWMYCLDDGINAARSETSEGGDMSITISGGSLYIDANSEGDGLDSNGTILLSGGELIISSTTDIRDTTLDYSGDSASVTGGTFLGTGSASQTSQNFSLESSTQGSIFVELSTVTSGDVTLTDSSGNILVQFTPAKDYQTVTISIPELAVGETYTLTTGLGDQSIVMDSLIYGTGNESGGMSGGMSMGGGMSGNRR